MCGAARRGRDPHGGRALFPEATPPHLNHAVVTGKLLSDPREGRGPSGDPVVLLEIEFPVAHPEHPRFLWAHATYQVEVPGDVGGQDVNGLRKGTPVLVSGQLSERLLLEDSGTSRHPAIVAALLRPGPSPAQAEARE